jgi:L-alanine-DL-glutamate epimerase-like enolase superfamily enzyme
MNAVDLVSVGFSISLEKHAYRTPMKFGGRVVEDVTLVNVACEATNRSGKHAVGLGSMTMGVAWAWPSRFLDSNQTLTVVVQLAEHLGTCLANELATGRLSLESAGHPLEICHRLHPLMDRVAEQLEREHQLPEKIPPLARLLASSPLQAAIFDAHGKAAGISSYRLLGPEFLSGDLSRFLGPEFTGKTLDQYVLPKPVDSLPIYHLVGALDPLFPTDVSSPRCDGLPENLGEWIAREGLTHLKIKLDGADSDWDLQRILSVNQIATTCSPGDSVSNAKNWHFSLDFNERCENEQYVLTLLDRIEKKSPEAFKRIAYIEQPTHRDLRLHPENTMHRVAARLPVVIDESLVDYESLLLAREQGYSGVAIKACKGHADALLMAAAAQFHDMFLCVQDLTCVGTSFLHSASLTAHLPGAAAIEGNGRQYCPAANAGWEERFPGMFSVSNGRLPTVQLAGPGLGY